VRKKPSFPPTLPPFFPFWYGVGNGFFAENVIGSHSPLLPPLLDSRQIAKKREKGKEEREATPVLLVLLSLSLHPPFSTLHLPSSILYPWVLSRRSITRRGLRMI
jgi:hypothetical protein